MAASAILAIKILADATQASKGLDEASAKTSKWSSGISKASAVATVGLAAVGAVLVSGVKSAAEDAQGQALLAKALKNSAGATDAQVAATEQFITKTSMATGVTDDELRPALASLARASGSTEQAQKDLALAMDISAATGKPLTAVSNTLAKGYSGQTAALGKLVPGMDSALVKSGDMAAIQDELARKVGGSAAAAADTAAGKFRIFQTALGETKEGIGAALLPVLLSLTTMLAGVANWAEANSGKVTVLVGVFAALAAIIVTVNAVTKVWTTLQTVAKAATTAWSIAQKILNLTLAANPILLVVIAIAALVAIIILAYKNSETFRNIVDAAFHAVQAAAAFAFTWIKNNWPLLLAIITGPIGLAVLAIAKHWDAIKAGAQAVIGWFRSAWGVIEGLITDPFQTAWNIIQAIIKKITDAVDHVTGLIKKIPVPHVPDLNPFSASAPSGAVVGATATFRGVARSPATGRGTASGGGVNVNVYGALDPEGVARQIRRILSGHDVRTGRSVVTAT